MHLNAGMEVVCPNLTAPSGGSVDFDPRVGKQAGYRCDPRLVLIGEETRLCQADGEWSREEPVCVTPCPHLTDPPNGAVTQNGNTLGSTACYTCVTGFQPTAMCRTCLINGEWSGMEIICERKGRSISQHACIHDTAPQTCCAPNMAILILKRRWYKMV